METETKYDEVVLLDSLEEEKEEKESITPSRSFSPDGIDIEQLRQESSMYSKHEDNIKDNIELQSPEERIEAIKEEVERWKEKRMELNRINADLQRKASYIWSKRGNSQSVLTSNSPEEKQKEEEKESSSSSSSSSSSQVADTESLLEKERHYLKLLDHIAEMKERGAQEISDFTVLSSEMQRQLEKKEMKVNELQESLREFKRNVCRSAQNSRTGDPIPRSLIQQFEAVEAQKDEDLEKVRLKNIHLNMTLQKLEADVSKKEQLAEGLHLIDFEQLKIENQSFNEKIEEKSGDIETFKRKKMMTVQVLSHFKMKVHALRQEIESKHDELLEKEQNLTNKRDTVSSLKRIREQLKKEVQALKRKQGFASTDLLVVDFQFQRDEMDHLEHELHDLKRQYEQLEEQLISYHETLETSQPSSMYPFDHEEEDDDQEVWMSGRLKA